MKPEIENLKVWMSGKITTGYQRALAMREFEQLLTYVAELEQLRKQPVIGSLRNDRIKNVANEIANSKTKGFSEEWEKFREEQYKYWLKRIRWATRSNNR